MNINDTIDRETMNNVVLYLTTNMNQ